MTMGYLDGDHNDDDYDEYKLFGAYDENNQYLILTWILK
jgi:hypothetical protein